MRVISLILVVALSGAATSASHAQSAQEFLAQEFAKGEGARNSGPKYMPRPAPSRIAIGIGGSWLERNIGASRPAGAPGAWCGYAMRMEVMSLGHPDPGPAFNHVSHWCGWGRAAPIGTIGSIFVSRGHVSRVTAGDCPRGTVSTISGNATGRRVSFMCEPLSRHVCSRMP